MNFVQSNGHALAHDLNKKLCALLAVLDVKEGDAKGFVYADLVTQRYEAALQIDEYAELAGTSVASAFRHTLHHIHRLQNASDSWFDTSCRNTADSSECDGDQLIDWKGRGYRTIFDVLMVYLLPTICLALIQT